MSDATTDDGIDGAGMTAGAFVYLIDRPKDWQPTGPDDLPPGVRRVRRDSPELARIFGRHYNEREMAEPVGRWALV